MKTMFLMLTASIISMAGCANIRHADKDGGDFDFALESGNFSDTGAIALHRSDYRFTVILVNNLDWALKSLEIADYGLPHISRFKRGERVTPFLTFMAFNSGDVDLTYSVRLQGSYTKPVEEHNNLIIARSTVNESMGYPAREFATFNFDETDNPGIYQLLIVIKNGENIINACVMQFELTE